jgi:hypothetical protein
MDFQTLRTFVEVVRQGGFPKPPKWCSPLNRFILGLFAEKS